MCARLGSRLLQVGINFLKVPEELCGVAGGQGAGLGTQKQTNKTHASDATVVGGKGGDGVISGKHEDKADDGPG